MGLPQLARVTVVPTENVESAAGDIEFLNCCRIIVCLQQAESFVAVLSHFNLSPIDAVRMHHEINGHHHDCQQADDHQSKRRDDRPAIEQTSVEHSLGHLRFGAMAAA